MKNDDIQVIVLAGGKGTRMGNGDVPKVLVELSGKPLLSYILQNVRMLEWENKPIVVVGYKHELVEDTFGDKYTYAFQEQQLGTGHAVLTAKDFVKAKNIIVVYGDMPFISADSLEKLGRLHEELTAKVTMFTSHAPNFDDAFTSLLYYGRVIRDGEGNVAEIVEFRDCTPEQKQLSEVNPGIYAFSSEWLWPRLQKLENRNAQAEYYLTDIAKMAIEEGEKVHSLAIPPQEVVGVNSKTDLEFLEKLV